MLSESFSGKVMGTGFFWEKGSISNPVSETDKSVLRVFESGRVVNFYTQNYGLLRVGVMNGTSREEVYYSSASPVFQEHLKEYDKYFHALVEMREE